jgi:hypothetical protein
MGLLRDVGAGMGVNPELDEVLPSLEDMGRELADAMASSQSASYV